VPLAGHKQWRSKRARRQLASQGPAIKLCDLPHREGPPGSPQFQRPPLGRQPRILPGKREQPRPPDHLIDQNAPSGGKTGKARKGLKFIVNNSTRKSRDLNSKLRRNVQQWKNHEKVTQRRGVFKNLTYNPTGYRLDRKQPLKQRGCMLVNSHNLTATLGKRRTVIEEAVPLGPQEMDPILGYALTISGGKLCLVPRMGGAYMKNLKFLQGNQKSCRHLKYVAHFISDYGITVRLYKKLSLAAMLVTIGKANRAMRLYRSVANRCGYLRHKWTEHAILSEGHLSGNSSYSSDW